MRLAAFIIALLLLTGSIDPSRGWLIALVVVTGLVALRIHLWRPWHLQPAIDTRLATFVIAVLLLVGAIDPVRGWLIALTVVSGLAMVSPHALSIDLFGRRGNRSSHRRWRSDARDWTPSNDDDREWQRWERHMDRRFQRAAGHAGDDWS